MLKEKKGKLAEIFETRINGRPLEGASKHLAINNDRCTCTSPPFWTHTWNNRRAVTLTLSRALPAAVKCRRTVTSPCLIHVPPRVKSARSWQKPRLLSVTATTMPTETPLETKRGESRSGFLERHGWIERASSSTRMSLPRLVDHVLASPPSLSLFLSLSLRNWAAFVAPFSFLPSFFCKIVFGIRSVIRGFLGARQGREDIYLMCLFVTVAWNFNFTCLTSDVSDVWIKENLKYLDDKLQTKVKKLFECYYWNCAIYIVLMFLSRLDYRKFKVSWRWIDVK